MEEISELIPTIFVHLNIRSQFMFALSSKSNMKLILDSPVLWSLITRTHNNLVGDKSFKDVYEQISLLNTTINLSSNPFMDQSTKFPVQLRLTQYVAIYNHVFSELKVEDDVDNQALFFDKLVSDKEYTLTLIIAELFDEDVDEILDSYYNSNKKVYNCLVKEKSRLLGEKCLVSLENIANKAILSANTGSSIDINEEELANLCSNLEGYIYTIDDEFDDPIQIEAANVANLFIALGKIDEADDIIYTMFGDMFDTHELGEFYAMMDRKEKLIEFFDKESKKDYVGYIASAMYGGAPNVLKYLLGLAKELDYPLKYEERLIEGIRESFTFDSYKEFIEYLRTLEPTYRHHYIDKVRPAKWDEIKRILQ